MGVIYGKSCDQGYIPAEAYRASKATTEPRLNLSALEPAIKAKVWRAIKRDAPALMEQLSSMRELVDAFDGEVTLALVDLPQSVLDITGRSV